jgi:prepilin peptidase CpaA
VSAAALLLPFAAPVCLYVAWTDMARMKIPNAAVLALLAVFAVVGPVALPIGEYGLRWLHVAGVLMLGFTANALGMLGAGDAKLAAAIAPFVARQDAGAFAMLFAITLLAAFAVHRLACAVPAIRRRTPHWQSWQRRHDFPLALALGPSLVFYLALSI